MSHKDELSAQRMNTVINNVSKYQEIDCNIVVDQLIILLKKEMGVNIVKESSIKLKEVVAKLKTISPEQDFFYYFDTSKMRPDGRNFVFIG